EGIAGRKSTPRAASNSPRNSRNGNLANPSALGLNRSAVERRAVFGPVALQGLQPATDQHHFWSTHPKPTHSQHWAILGTIGGAWPVPRQRGQVTAFGGRFGNHAASAGRTSSAATIMLTLRGPSSVPTNDSSSMNQSQISP